MRSRAFRPLGLSIHVASVPAAPFTRRYPRDFTFYLADPISSIRGDWLFPICGRIAARDH
jgi:hypothetical protein